MNTYEVISRPEGKSIIVEAATLKSAVRKAHQKVIGRRADGPVQWYGKHAEVNGCGTYDRPVMITKG